MRRGISMKAVLAVSLGMFSAACGGDAQLPGPSAGGSEPTVPSSTSSPFTVDGVPSDLALVAAGRGEQITDWGTDSNGTDEPFTVLSPGGTAADSGAVVVSVTGFEGQQGGLHQSSRSYPHGEHERFRVDGHDAIFAPAASTDEWADLVAVRGDEVAVRVASRGAGREELVALLPHIHVPAARGDAPIVDPPEGLSVLGSMSADAVVAFRAVAARDGSVPGPGSAHAAVWAWPDREEAALWVATLPGQSADLDALPGMAARLPAPAPMSIEPREVDGRAARLLRPDDGSGMTLWAQTDWGDLVVVHSQDTASVGEADLIELVRSVAPADDATWEDVVIEAWGGPGLHPDPGRVEISRGSDGDVEWLLQSAPGVPGVDTCLKLSTRARRCSTGTEDTPLAQRHADHEGMVILLPRVDASSIRATSSSGDVVTAPLVELPSGADRVAVLFVDPPGDPVCVDDHSRHRVGDPGTVTFEAIGADGQVVACLGPG